MSTWVSTERRESGAALTLKGDWRLENLSAIEQELQRVHAEPGIRWSLDGGDLNELDTSGAMLAVRFLQAQGVSSKEAQFENFSLNHSEIIQLANDCVSPSMKIRKPEVFGFLGQIGEATFEFLLAVRSILQFIGLTSVELLRALVRPKLLRGKELVVQLEETGVNAIPIVILVNFLIGIVIAYLSGVQLESYGANVFVVDGVALGTVRELSPILVAIIVAGRSGSAFTAQIGAMKLNEEIDAIATVGLSPIRVLVVPRIIALMIVMPILVLAADAAGILGGMLIADLRLSVTGATFIARLQTVLSLQHVFAGLAKAPVFAFFIATIGCRMGMQVESNAQSVGTSTTSTVVRSIVIVILLNAAFAVIYSELGI